MISNSVARHTGEIGLRMALALGKTAGAMLFGLKPYDPLTISLSALALAVVAWRVACLRAARRSSIPWPPSATNKTLRLVGGRFQGT